MLDYSDDSLGKFMHDLQEIGLMVNEMKQNGETTIPIETYEDVLGTLIFMVDNYRELEERHDSFARSIGETLGVTYYK